MRVLIRKNGGYLRPKGAQKLDFNEKIGVIWYENLGVHAKKLLTYYLQIFSRVISHKTKYVSRLHLLSDGEVWNKSM